jgi:hypothetical protein
LFSPGTPVSSINKKYRHDITEICFEVALNTCSYHASFVLKLWFNGVNAKVTEELRTYNALIKQDE